MFKTVLQNKCDNLKMVKTKCEMKSPRRRMTGNLTRPISRARPLTTSATTVSAVGANMKVVVRVRPPNEKEMGDNQRVVVKIVDDHLVIFDPKEDSQPFFYHGVQQKSRDLLKKANKHMQFVFDRVFGFDSSNNDLFENSTKYLIESLMDGYNCSVFVYGATGAGKTHTMLGSNENPGITFLTMAELFKRKEELANERDFELAITYLEVYNENVQDLLKPGIPLQLREDGKYGVTVAGILVKRVESAEELFDLLKQGNQNRTQHPTDANAESSRSHAVFQVYVRMNMKTTGEMRLSKLSMIDLAGSERGSATGCTGARFAEGANINKSLLALGNCINSLADGQRHVPYRDSKLTRLLKDSLGGNCQTIMIANVSPSSLSYEDTYNTLKYATRAKKIKSNMKKNVVNCEMHVEQYVKLNEELNKEIEKLRAQLAAKATYTPSQETLTLATMIDESTKKDLKALYAERCEITERLYNLECTEQILYKRIKMKQDSDSRLSGLCIDSQQKDQGHKRMENVIDRFQKKAFEIASEIDKMKIKRDELKAKTEEFLGKLPPSENLQQFVELENAKLLQLEYKYKMEKTEKINKLQETELSSRGSLLEKMSKMMRSSFLQAKGYGYLTESYSKDYYSLVRQLQGISSVTWDEEITDSGLDSTESVTTTTTEEEGRGSKRKLAENTTSSTTSLDNTFTLTEKPRAFNLCAEQLMAKVYKPPPAKRVAKYGSASPRVNKENRAPLRKPIGTMGTAQRFPSNDVNNKAMRMRKPIK